MNGSSRRVPASQMAVALGFLSSLIAGPANLRAQTAADVFRRFAPAVAKLEIVEPLSSAPRSVGTAFFVEGYGEGFLLTNYHVVKDVIFDEDKRLRLEFARGETTEDVEILALDAAHDVAVLRTDAQAPARLSLLLGAPPSMGTELYSLGHPADLATSVVEGIYNGRVGHSVSPRYHFTGSVNPGMSGGPTVTASGLVVGINVSTAGNQLSFIVPSVLADGVLQEAQTYDGGTPTELGERLGRRLEIFQRNFFGIFLDHDLPEIRLGEVTVPVGPDASFDCGAEPFEDENRRYDQVVYRCTTFDQISWPDGAVTPFIAIEHIYIESDQLNRFQFSRLYGDIYAFVAMWEVPENDEAGDWECRRGNVRSSRGSVMKVAFCARAHRRMPGLYDAFIRTALLGGDHASGVVGTFLVNGVTFDHAVQLSRHVLNGYEWNE